MEPNPNECPICLIDYDETDKKTLECPGNHSFHADCINAWLETRVTCPLCRVPVIAPVDNSSMAIDIIKNNSIDFYGNLQIVTDLNIFGNLVLNRQMSDRTLVLNSLTITNGDLNIYGTLSVAGTININGTMAIK